VMGLESDAFKSGPTVTLRPSLRSSEGHSFVFPSGREGLKTSFVGRP
jgi:hypothetical protein